MSHSSIKPDAATALAACSPIEKHFTFNGFTYAAQLWGEDGGLPVIALHGWLDNALSFSVIAPYLAQFRLLALDLSGQGHTDHRSQDATYHIWDDVPQLLGIVEQN